MENGRTNGDGQLEFGFPEINPRVLKLHLLLAGRRMELIEAYRKILELKKTNGELERRNLELEEKYIGLVETYNSLL